MSEGGLLDVVSGAIDRLGLRRSPAGRRLIAQLNVLGKRCAHLLYLRRGRPHMVDGHAMFLADRHAPSLNFVRSLLADRYEPETKQLLADLIGEGMIVFDVGAHVGHYTLMAARLVGPRGHVYAFEADAENFSLLQRNVAANGYTNVTCVPKAVSDRTGTLTFYVSRQGNDRHSIVADPATRSAATAREVATVTLDEFAASVDCPRIDVLKMDIEGAEPLALAGMAGLLRRSDRAALVIEFAPSVLRAAGTEPTEFLARLRDLDFSIAGVEVDLSDEALRGAALPAAMQEIERRGAINLLCRRVAAARRPEPAARVR